MLSVLVSSVVQRSGSNANFILTTGLGEACRWLVGISGSGAT